MPSTLLTTSTDAASEPPAPALSAAPAVPAVLQQQETP
jgi:hypothetical protein